MIRAGVAGLALIATPVAAETVDQVAARYQLAGEVLVARGGKVLVDRGYGTIDPAGGKPHKAGERWRLASITKQVTAALVVGGMAADPEITSPARDVFGEAAGQATGATGAVPPAPAAVIADWLDAIIPLPVLLNKNLGALTMRHLLTHHSGLANPDDTVVGPDGVPAAYTRGSGADASYCMSKPAIPGAPFAYNNCDYIIAGEVLRYSDVNKGGRMPPPLVWPKGLAMAARGETGVPGFVGGKPEPQFELASWGAAGGLTGTARAVFDFDRSLTTGKLMPLFARDAMWTPEGNGSYQALGQWVFPGKLNGCAAPKRIVQRDGEIYGVQARNFILPDDDLIVIVFTNRSADDFPIGEIWQGKGFAYDLLSAVACS